MRVKFKTFGFEREMTLEAALNSSQRSYREGALECAFATANDNAEVMARLLAHLVETKVIELEAAFSIAGVYVEELEVSQQ